MYSKLTDKVILTDHYDSRGGAKICKITIHHMAGNLSIETCGSVFQTREASANYGIGSDGRIGCYVYEENRAWSTANYTNDKQAINIELANDGGAETNWHVSDIAIEKCIDLCVDICQRYGFSLVYDETPNGSLTRHNMFMATTCPGGYLQSKFPYIAQEVNKRLSGDLPEVGTWFVVNDPDGIWLLDENGDHIEAYGQGTDVIYQGLGYQKYGYQYYYVQVNGDKKYGYMAKDFLSLKYPDVDPEPTPEPEPEPTPIPSPSDDEIIAELNATIEELNNKVMLQEKQIAELIHALTWSKCEFKIEEDNYYKIKMNKEETLCIKFAKDTEFEMKLDNGDNVKVK